VIEPLTAERLEERGRALGAWLAAGLSIERLIRLDRAVRRGTRSDWPGRESGPEVRQGIPDLDLPDRPPPDPDPPPPGWQRVTVCARCGAEPAGCGCRDDLDG
jgi:hypothetical protein